MVIHRIQFPGPGGSFAGVVSLPQSTPAPGVVVIGSEGGDEFSADLCSRLSGAGFAAMFPVTSDLKADSNDYLAEVSASAIGYLIGSGWIAPTQVALVGVGPGVAIGKSVAVATPQFAAGLVALYGSLWETPDAGLHVAVQGHYAEGGFQPARGDVIQMQRELGSDEVTVFLYPGVEDGFLDSTKGAYDESAARLAWDRIISFLNRVLPPGDVT
jgi:dienelactone hydrolase